MTDKERLEFVDTLDENWLGWWMLQQIEKKKLDKHDAAILDDACYLAMQFYWYIIEDDPRVYSNLQKEEYKAERVTLWKKWSTQFNLLLHEHQADCEEVEKAIRFVIKTKCCLQAVYSANHFRRNYLQIRNRMLGEY